MSHPTGNSAAWQSEQHRRSRASKAQLLLIDKLLKTRPLLAMHVRPKVGPELSRSDAGQLIDWLRAGGKGDMPELGGS